MKQVTYENAIDLQGSYLTLVLSMEHSNRDWNVTRNIITKHSV